MAFELVEIGDPEDTIVEVLRLVNPKDALEPVTTRTVEWLDECHFRSTEVAGDPLDAD